MTSRRSQCLKTDNGNQLTLTVSTVTNTIAILGLSASNHFFYAATRKNPYYLRIESGFRIEWRRFDINKRIVEEKTEILCGQRRLLIFIVFVAFIILEHRKPVARVANRRLVATGTVPFVARRF